MEDRSDGCAALVMPGSRTLGVATFLNRVGSTRLGTCSIDFVVLVYSVANFVGGSSVKTFRIHHKSVSSERNIFQVPESCQPVQVGYPVVFEISLEFAKLCIEVGELCPAVKELNPVVKELCSAV